MLGLYGGVIAMGGVYLAAHAAGFTQARCLAAVLLANGLIALKWTVMEAGKLKQQKWPAAAWAVSPPRSPPRHLVKTRRVEHHHVHARPPHARRGLQPAQYYARVSVTPR